MSPSASLYPLKAVSSVFLHFLPCEKGSNPSLTHARTLRVCLCACVRVRARSQVSSHRQIEKGFPNFPDRVANEKVRVAFNNVGKLQTMLIIFLKTFFLNETFLLKKKKTDYIYTGDVTETRKPYLRLGHF